MQALRIDERLVIPGNLLSYSAVRASGAGGQNVNKVASKVELVFDVWACEQLSAAARQRLVALCKNRLDAEGRVRVVSQATRDQAKNLEDARAKLTALIHKALSVPKARRATKPTRGSKLRRLESKQKQSHKKSMRGRVGAED